MFEGIAIGFIVGGAAGVVFGKYVYSEATSIKAHVTAEIKSLEGRLKAKL